MTEKELLKLKRQDLLQLLLDQGRDAADYKARLEETELSLAEAEETIERLKNKLNEKDELLDKLKGRLDEKDAMLNQQREEMDAWLTSRRIELEEAGSIAEAALRLNDVFEAAQSAANQYIYNLRYLSWEKSGKNNGEPEPQPLAEEFEYERK